MAISRESFFSGNFIRKKKKENSQHPIIKFLRKNHGNAFTVKEISKAIGFKENTIRSFLFQAKKKNLVLHNSPYFIMKLSPREKNQKRISKKNPKKKSRR